MNYNIRPDFRGWTVQSYGVDVKKTAYDVINKVMVNISDIDNISDWRNNQVEYCKTNATTFDWVDHCPYDLLLPQSHPWFKWKSRCKLHIKLWPKRNDDVVIKFKWIDLMKHKGNIENFLMYKAKSNQKFGYASKPIGFWDGYPSFIRDVNFFN